MRLILVRVALKWLKFLLTFSVLGPIGFTCVGLARERFSIVEVGVASKMMRVREKRVREDGSWSVERVTVSVTTFNKSDDYVSITRWHLSER